MDNFVKCSSISMCREAGLPISAKDIDSLETYQGAVGNVCSDLHSLARESAKRSGVDPLNLSRDNCGHLILGSLSRPRGAIGSDFVSDTVAAAVSKSFALGQMSSPATYKAWCGSQSVRDFRDYSRISLHGFGSLNLLPEGAGPNAGNIDSKTETGKISVYEKSWQFTRENAVNNDIESLLKNAFDAGKCVERTINKAVYACLTSNPTMAEDNISLFDASTHGNYVTPGSAPTAGTIAAASGTMATQTFLDKVEDTTNAVPAFLICPCAMRETAEGALDAAASVGMYVLQTMKPEIIGRGAVQVVYDSALDVADSKAWYLCVDSRVLDTLLVLRLKGYETPEIRVGGNKAGQGMSLIYQVIFPFGVMAGDYRGLYKNAGGA